MKRIALTLLVLVPGIAAADNVGGCGWGSKVMDGNQGIAPQVLALTTNGTFSNAAFGISSGTSGCTQDGVVKSDWKLAAFVDENRPKLARDVSVGSGESLNALAELLSVEKADRDLFASVTREQFDRIFPTSSVATPQILASLKAVLAENATLAKYSTQL